MTNLKLIGSKITKIEAERNPDFVGNLEIKTNIKINSIKNADEIKELKNASKISYKFEINYGKLGKIIIEGIIFLSGDPKIMKELLKSKNNEKYNSEEYIMITNIIIQKASIKSFELEEELGLPLHIKLPSISFKSKENSK